MDFENLKSNVIEEYADDITRFFPDGFSVAKPENGMYEEIMEKSAMCYTDYLDAFEPFDYLYDTRTLEGMCHELTDSYSLLYYVNKVEDCIRSFIAFYCYHKSYFVDLHIDEVKKNMTIIERILGGLQEECNFLDYSASVDKKSKFKYNHIAERIKDIEEHSTIYVYGVHSIGEVVEPNNGIPPTRLDLDVPAKDYESWANEGVGKMMRSSKKQRDQLMAALGILFLQLFRLHHLFLVQMDEAEIIEEDDFFTPLFKNVSILFEGSKSQKLARNKMMHKLNKAKGYGGSLNQMVLEEVWKDYSTSMLETRVGKIWDDCAGDANEFSRTLFMKGCTEEELTEFLGSVYCMYYLEHPEESNRTKGIELQKSDLMVSNPQVNQILREITSSDRQVNVTVNVLNNGDVVGHKTNESYGDNYSVFPGAKVETKNTDE